MKIKIVFLIIALSIFSSVAIAQSVAITGKNVTYKRPKPIADHKKDFTITYPKIKASTPAISKKIEAVLSYEKAFDFTLREELLEVQWLENASYDVNYNANKILSVSLSIEGSGAYPSSSTRYVVVNTATGRRVLPSDVFTNTGGLLAKLVKMKNAEIEKTKTDLKNDPETKDEDLSGLFKDAETYHKVKLNEFEIDENGVIFHHDYGFPHVVQAWQPVGEFFLTWKDLKPYIKKGGLLAALAR